MSFLELGVDSDLAAPIAKLGFERPTAVQNEVIPHVLEGRDTIGIAKTGSGKTAAYLLPIMTRMLKSKGRRRTRVLVLVPTRELALQVEKMTEPFTEASGFRVAAVYGGVRLGPQIKALRGNVDIVAATPGRLLDHMERGNIRLKTIEYLVLDEADRMLDIGFLPDIRRIVAQVPEKRQTLLFSATMPADVERLAVSIMENPVRLHVGDAPGAKPTMPVGITHAVYPVGRGKKVDLLVHLISQANAPSVLIFTRTRRGSDRLADRLKRAGLAVSRIHSDLSQEQRVRALEGFRHKKVQVLVATDIAARGLDVQDISHVINFDVPEDPEVYIHRVGRTARLEAKGDAFTLVAPDELLNLGRVEDSIGRRLPRIVLPEFDYGPDGPPKVTLGEAAPKPYRKRRPRRIRFKRR
jgi:ATP-dependent RNA helicase RhlE